MGELVKDLIAQLQKTDLNFEIRLYDDCSNEEYLLENRKLASISGVIYLELPNNLGRSKSRNLLAKEASYENLLFLDCDIRLFSPNYVLSFKNYLFDYQVIIGGNAYENTQPKDKRFILHWLVGKKREQKLAILRNVNPFESITLNNMLIKREIYLHILLDETIVSYGHEDTKFGFDLEKAGIDLLHIDNPVYHIGLNTSEEFLKKSAEAIEVLYQLTSDGKILKPTKLFKMYAKIRSLAVSHVLFRILKVLKVFIFNNLVSSKPSMIVFDLFKLLTLNELDENKRAKIKVTTQ